MCSRSRKTLGWRRLLLWGPGLTVSTGATGARRSQSVPTRMLSRREHSVMRTIHRLIEAKKAQSEEEGKEAGFSLIELIIVVVILGVLVAIAIPIFSNIQKQAEDNSLKAAAANGASAAAAALAVPDAVIADATTAAATAGDTAQGITTLLTSTDLTIDSVCVSATGFTRTVSAGPGCADTAKVIQDAP